MIRKGVLKGYLGLWLVAFSILSICSSNNSNVPYIDRLLEMMKIPVWSRGIHGGTHYSAIVRIIIFFIGYVMIAKYGNHVHEFFHKHTFLTVIIIIATVILVNDGTIRIIKGCSTGVDSIYCYKHKSNVNYSKKNYEKPILLNGEFMLENLSKEEVRFNICLLPLNEHMKDKILLGEVVLKGKEKKNITLTRTYISDSELWSGSGFSRTFKFALEDHNNIKIINLEHVLGK
ncbi:hypothetical protein [Oceanirhabdus sp. W0125-5]|uniref:hypothetical protein n=1 Tax=Oceanirhabdus sp. W0125-5 TaxID=2999116 RepID=UPI0022F31CB6|nr:hypothetical protein [Oceanirhabdus sp. W0125-5]WBW95535.1 hypothetical protein OW730_17805 [Oceanirhabdus sp. W0125-5]